MLNDAAILEADRRGQAMKRTLRNGRTSGAWRRAGPRLVDWIVLVALALTGVPAFVTVGFDVVSGAGSTAVQGPLKVLPVTVVAEPVDASAASSFSLFGLQGDIQILWDPDRRIPVEITGSVAVFGSLTVRLATAKMRQPGTTAP